MVIDNFDILSMEIIPVDDFEPIGQSIKIQLRPYCLCPNSDCSSYQHVSCSISDALKGKNFESKFFSFTKPIQPAQLASQWTVFIRITYHVTNKAMFRVIFPPTMGQLNMIMLHMAHAAAYKLMYDLDKQAEISPPYGIWEHKLANLLYNGDGQLQISDTCLVCQLDCDSR